MTVFSIKENSRRQIRKSKKTQCRVKIINYVQNNYSNKMKIKMLGFKNAFLLSHQMLYVICRHHRNIQRDLEAGITVWAPKLGAPKTI